MPTLERIEKILHQWAQLYPLIGEIQDRWIGDSHLGDTHSEMKKRLAIVTYG